MNTRSLTFFIAAVMSAGAVSRLTAGSEDDKTVSTPEPTPPATSSLDDFFRPVADVRYDYNFPMGMDSIGGRIGDDEIQADLPLPPLKTDSLIILPRVYYRYDQLDVNTPAYKGVFDLHTLRVPLEGLWLSKDTPWLVFAYVESGFSTDFNALNSGSFDLETALFVGYRFTPNFALAVGAFYTNEYGSTTVLPGGGFIWTPSKQVTMALTPAGFDAVYKCCEDWRLKLEAMPYGGRWTAQNDGQDQKIQFHGGKVGLQLEHRLFRQCWVSIGGGINLLNTFRVDGPGSLLADQTVRSGLYLGGGLRWQF